MQRALLILLVAASYLLFAGARPWTLGPLLIIAAAGVLAAPRKTLTLHAHTRALDRALIILLFGMIVQVLPLPAAVVSAVSPHADDVKAVIRFSTMTESPSWTTLSVNPRATLVSLGTLILGILSYWIARTVFGAGGSTRFCCRALTFLATLAAVMAAIQKAVSPRMVLFMIEPEARSANPFGAFVNRNHFAGWLLLAAGAVAGYFIARLHTHPRRGRWRESVGQVMSSGIVYTAMAVIVIIGVLLLTLSRSAVAGLGVAAVAGWWLGRPRLSVERTSLPALLGFIGSVLLVVVLFVDLDGWTTRMAQSFSGEPAAFSRISIWRESVPIARDFWPTGTGAGTYSDAMTLYQQSRVWVGSMQRWAHFNNAHSHYVQLAVEGGLLLLIPVAWALFCLTFLGLRAVRADKGEMFWVRVGAAAGLAGLAAQSIWEVALIMPANAVLAGMLAGLLLYHRDAPRDEAGALTPELLPPPPRARMA